MAKLFAHRGDPDQMLRSVASDLGLPCLPITLLLMCLKTCLMKGKLKHLIWVCKFLRAVCANILGKYGTRYSLLFTYIQKNIQLLHSFQIHFYCIKKKNTHQMTFMHHVKSLGFAVKQIRPQGDLTSPLKLKCTQLLSSIFYHIKNMHHTRAPDKASIQINVFLISPWKHMLWKNKKNITILWEKEPYLDLWKVRNKKGFSGYLTLIMLNKLRCHAHF